MTTKSIPCLMLLLTTAVFSATAATQQINETQTEEIVVGVPLPLTGTFADFGLMMKNSFEMARVAINNAGGIHDRPLQLVYANDRSDANHAESVIDELVDGAGSVMLVGGYQSDVTYALARLADQRDVPFLISTAATDRITQRRWRNIYRLNPPVSEYTTSLEDFLLKELHPDSMTIVYENSMFGTDAATRMMSFLQENGIEVRDLIGYSAKRADPAYLRSLLAPMTREPPDIIHMVSYLADGIALVKTIRELGLSSRLTGAAAGFTHPDFLEGAADSADGLLVATLWSNELPYPGAKTYHETYLAQHGVAPNYHGAEAYSALLVVADALRRAESFKPEDIRRSLDQTYMNTPFGPVKFYSYENFERQNSVRTQVLELKSGMFRVVWPPDLATASMSEN